MKAPLKKGAKIGEIILFKDGIEMDRVALLSVEEVKSASVMDRLKKIARDWNG